MAKPSAHVMVRFTKLSKAYSEAGKHHPAQLQVGKAHFGADQKIPTTNRLNTAFDTRFFKPSNKTRKSAEIPSSFKDI